VENMFDEGVRTAIERRLTALQPGCARQWGKMTAAQMLAHCAAALDTPLGERREAQTILGRLIGPFVRSSVFGDTPLQRGVPTDKELVVADNRDFFEEQRRLLEKLTTFCDRGPAGADGQVHSFFGRLSGQDWGRFVYKHLDHHLRQFNG
jgi:hypothetical protein